MRLFIMEVLWFSACGIISGRVCSFLERQYSIPFAWTLSLAIIVGLLGGIGAIVIFKDDQHE